MKPATNTSRAIARTAARPKPNMMVWGLLILALIVVAACDRRKDRIAFDGQFFRANANHVDRNTRQDFEVTVRPFSASAEGAREAGRYEATRYCVVRYGSSKIEWTDGPDAEDGTLRVDGDTLILTGTCTP